jgi:hypothetical protein
MSQVNEERAPGCILGVTSPDASKRAIFEQALPIIA